MTNDNLGFMVFPETPGLPRRRRSPDGTRSTPGGRPERRGREEVPRLRCKR